MNCYKCKYSTPTFTKSEDDRMIVICELHNVELAEISNCRCGEDFFKGEKKSN